MDSLGEPIYTYALKQGISDGFLAPYKVVRIDLDKDLTAGGQRRARPTAMATRGPTANPQGFSMGFTCIPKSPRCPDPQLG
jgi:superfamily II DNA or RNA helicase